MNTQPENQETECQQVSQALSAHFDGAANDDEQQLATAHLAQCSSCAQMWREWQSLRLMEQRALEPVASGEMLPLAPVKVPRHLKAAILRQTVSPPIWQRFWPRLLTGMAVPTVAVACWLLIVAAPWQQTLPEISTPSVPIPENRVATVSEESIITPPSVTNKNSSEVIVVTGKFDSTNTTESAVVPTINNNISSPDHQIKSRPASAATISKTKQTSQVATASLNKPSKSTSTRDTKPRTQNPEPRTRRPIVVKTPQISMASLDQPSISAAKPAVAETAKPIITVAPKPRATEPVLIAALPNQDMTSATDETSNPVLEYIAANDVRPDDIRLAVENYRAALLDDGSDL